MPITSGLITDIHQLDLDGLYTYADYLKWRFKERVELIKGRVFRMSPALSRLHQEVSLELTGQLYQYFKQKTCNLYVAPFDVRLPIGADGGEVLTVVQPDLCVVCDPAKLDDQGCLGAPDWIIEILSPGNSEKEKKYKFELYEEAGVGEYWLVDPADQTVLVYWLNEQGKYIGMRPFVQMDRIRPHTFPDLEISLAEVFKTKLH